VWKKCHVLCEWPLTFFPNHIPVHIFRNVSFVFLIIIERVLSFEVLFVVADMEIKHGRRAHSAKEEQVKISFS
jgi:hypothetical protein